MVVQAKSAALWIGLATCVATGGCSASDGEEETTEAVASQDQKLWGVCKIYTPYNAEGEWEGWAWRWGFTVDGAAGTGAASRCYTGSRTDYATCGSDHTMWC
jgi:hypothetical protein